MSLYLPLSIKEYSPIQQLFPQLPSPVPQSIDSIVQTPPHTNYTFPPLQAIINFTASYKSPDDEDGPTNLVNVIVQQNTTVDDDQQMLLDIEQNIANLEKSLQKGEEVNSQTMMKDSSLYIPVHPSRFIRSIIKWSETQKATPPVEECSNKWLIFQSSFLIIERGTRTAKDEYIGGREEGKGMILIMEHPVSRSYYLVTKLNPRRPSNYYFYYYYEESISNFERCESRVM